eukprot:1148534-Pelagomonas_calceolata.AAC.2
MCSSRTEREQQLGNSRAAAEHVRCCDHAVWVAALKAFPWVAALIALPWVAAPKANCKYQAQEKGEQSCARDDE